MSKRPMVGDQVTCLVADEAYGSDYGMYKAKKIWFMPGMVGIVASIAPKVTKPHKALKDPRFDQADDFLVVDYIDHEGKQQRVGLHFCNAKVVSDSYEIVVKFTRSFSDDGGVVGLGDNAPVDPGLLVRQLVKELQSAYDHPAIAIAGSFDVVSGPTFS